MTKAVGSDAADEAMIAPLFLVMHQLYPHMANETGPLHQAIGQTNTSMAHFSEFFFGGLEHVHCNSASPS